MKADKNVRNARFLIASYWIYKVINGGSIPKTTLKAVLMEKRSAESAQQPKKAQAKTAARIPRLRSLASGLVSGPASRIIISFLKKQRVL